MSAPAKQRAVASEVTIALGLVRTTVDVIPARRSDGKAEFKLICPQCTTETRGQQMYICTQDESHQFTSAEADRAIEVDKVLRRVTEDEINAIKETSLPSGELTLMVFPADQVEAVCLPGGGVYRLRPRGENDQAYALLVGFLADPNYAFIGEMTMRSSQNLYRCSSKDGVVLVQEMIRPSEFYAAQPVNVAVDPRLIEVGAKLVETLCEDFDPERFANQIRERATALADAKRSGAPTPPKPKPLAPTASGTDQLLAMLTASVAAAGGGKAPAKKAARARKAS